MRSSAHRRTHFQPGTAVLYPIILPERLDLLLETPQGIERRSVPVSDKDLARHWPALASQLRGRRPYQGASQKLYDWLLRPVDPLLAAGKIDTVIFVPDGVLRLVPIWGVASTASRFAVQKYALATVPGLSMTNVRSRSPSASRASLLAGLVRNPGRWLTRFRPSCWRTLCSPFGQVGEVRGHCGPRLAGARAAAGTLGHRAGARQGTGRPSCAEELALPGVKREIEALSRKVQGRGAAQPDLHPGSVPGSGSPAGNTAWSTSPPTGSSAAVRRKSFIMTYDDLLDDGWTPGAAACGRACAISPIELLTLSACQTAEGDDRAPSWVGRGGPEGPGEKRDGHALAGGRRGRHCLDAALL